MFWHKINILLFQKAYKIKNALSAHKDGSAKDVKKLPVVYWSPQLALQQTFLSLGASKWKFASHPSKSTKVSPRELFP